MLNYRQILLALALIVSSAMRGQTIDLDDGTSPWEGGFNIGLNNDGYEFEVRLIYFHSQFLGIKAGLGFAGEIRALEDWNDEYYPVSRDYTARFIFNPAIVLRTPRIIYWKKQDAGIYLFAEPGIILSPGASGSHNAKITRWNVKSGINLQIDRYIVTLGYSVSNFSLYSGSPENHWGLPTKTEYLTHTVFVGGAIKF